MSKTAIQQNSRKTGGIFISLSREHSKYAKEIENCFKNSNVSVKADFMRFSAEELPMQILILLSSSIAGGVIYDLLKVGVQRVFNKFKKVRVSVRDNNGIIYNINQKGKINILVVPDRAKEFAHIKNVDDLIRHLQDQKTKNGWREMKLGDAPIEIIDGDRSKNYPKKNEFFCSGHCLFLNTKNVTDSGFSFSELNFITEEKDKFLRKGKLQRLDLILTTRGTVGNIAFFNKSVPYKNIRINSGMVIIRPNGIDPRFNYQLFKYLKNDFLGFASGSAQPQLPIRDMREIPVILPPLPEQKAIAEILSSLDDKIDLLHRQNKTLEDMVQALFRKWFIEEPNGNWEEKPLSYFGDVICGKTPSKKVYEYFDGDVPFIKIPDMHGNTFIFNTSDTLTEEGKNSQKNKTLPRKSICVSCIATVGLVSMNTFKSQTNQQINSIVPKKDEYRYFIYLFMKSSKDLLESMASGGTATMNLNTGNFAKILIPMSDENVIAKFHGIVEPLFEKIFFNQHQSRTLENLRDTLLPKLMSGAVKVKI